jgi:membrane protein
MKVVRAPDLNRFPLLRLGMRTTERYLDDSMAERAPAIAYYGLLSLFPALLVAFSVVRFVGGDSAPEEIAEYTKAHGTSGAVAGALQSAAKTARDADAATAGGIGVAGVLVLIYGASRAFTAIGRAVDAIGARARLGRSPLRRLQDIGWTLVLMAMAIVMVLVATVSGAVLEDLLGLFGIDDAAVTVVTLVRWPVAAALALLFVAIIRWAAPVSAHPPFRLISPGQVATAGSIAVLTAGYNVYITTFASYNTTYGAFAAPIILMLWIWMTASALLAGAELDAVLEEGDGKWGADGQPSTSPMSRARETASERDEASSLR